MFTFPHTGVHLGLGGLGPLKKPASEDAGMEPLFNCELLTKDESAPPADPNVYQLPSLTLHLGWQCAPEFDQYYSVQENVELVGGCRSWEIPNIPKKVSTERNVTGTHDKRHTVHVRQMATYFPMIELDSFIPVELIEHHLHESLTCEFDDYIKRPYQGSLIDHFYNAKGDACLAFCRGQLMNQLCVGSVEQVSTCVEPLVEFKTPLLQISVSPFCSESRQLVGLRMKGGVTLGSLDDSSGQDAPLWNRLSSMEYAYEPVDFCFHPLLSQSYSVLTCQGTVVLWNTETAQPFQRLDPLASFESKRFKACRYGSHYSTMYLLESKHLFKLDTREPTVRTPFIDLTSHDNTLKAMDSLDGHHIVVATRKNIQWYDERFPSRPLITWDDMDPREDITAIKCMHLNDKEVGIVSWTRHWAGVTLRSVDSTNLTSSYRPQSIPSFYQSSDYNYYDRYPDTTKFYSFADGESRCDLVPLWPPLLGVATSSCSSNLQVYQLADDGSIYSQTLSHSPPPPCLSLAPTRSRQPSGTADSSLSDPCLWSMEEIQDKLFEEKLAERDQVQGGMIKMGGFSTDTYPPPPLGPLIHYERHNIYHFQNIWKRLWHYIDPPLEYLLSKKNRDGIVMADNSLYMNLFTQSPHSFTIYEYHRLTESKQLKYDHHGCDALIPLQTRTRLHNETVQQELLNCMTEQGYLAEKRKLPLQAFFRPSSNENRTDFVQSLFPKRRPFFEQQDDQEAIDKWWESSRRKAIEWIVTDLELSTTLVHRQVGPTFEHAPLTAREESKKRKQEEENEVLRTMGTTLQTSIETAPKLLLKNRFLDSFPTVALSRAASELKARWSHPDQYYSEEAMHRLKPSYRDRRSTSVSSRGSTSRRRRYEEMMKARSDSILHDYIMSQQTMATSSQSTDVGPLSQPHVGPPLLRSTLPYSQPVMSSASRVLSNLDASMTDMSGSFSQPSLMFRPKMTFNKKRRKGF